MPAENNSYDAYQKCIIRDCFRAWMASRKKNYDDAEVELNEFLGMTKPPWWQFSEKKRGEHFSRSTLQRFANRPTTALNTSLISELVRFLKTDQKFPVDLDIDSDPIFDLDRDFKALSKRQASLKEHNRRVPVVKEATAPRLTIAGIKFPCEFQGKHDDHYRMRLWAEYDEDSDIILVFGNIKKLKTLFSSASEKISFDGILVNKEGLSYLICRDLAYFEPCLITLNGSKELRFRNVWLGKKHEKRQRKDIVDYKIRDSDIRNFVP